MLVELLALVGHDPLPTEESSFVVAESPFLPTSGGTSSRSRASSAAPMASIARDFGIPELRRPSAQDGPVAPPPVGGLAAPVRMHDTCIRTSDA